jgi:hypothetical protein
MRLKNQWEIHGKTYQNLSCFSQKKMGNPWKSPIKIKDFFHIKNQWEIHGNPIKI